MIGQVFSHYRIVEAIGSGGMGVVFKAEDLKLGRMVALKFLPPNLAKEPDAIERFRREARAASSLNHPGICTIYDIDEHEGRSFMAMELLEGRSLDKVIGGKPLDFATLVDYATQVADALGAAHAEGIVHRDIKPGNIFITNRGQVKIVDFGLAKLVGERQSPLGATDALTGNFDTSKGTALGTIAYMSPEQARGEVLDHRTDLFSFGVVLYEMTTGRQTFPGATSAVVFDAILNRAPVAPLALNPTTPIEMDRVIAKALEKDRQLRYQTSSDIRADLQRLKRDVDSGRMPAVSTPSAAVYVTAPAPPGGKSVAPVIAISAAIVLAGVIVAAGVWIASRRADQPVVTSTTPAASVALVITPSASLSPAPAPVPAPPPNPSPAVAAVTTPSAAEHKTQPASAPAPPRADVAADLLRSARAKVDAKLFDQALADLQTITRDYSSSPSAADAYLLIARVQEQQGRPDEAMAAYVELRSRAQASPQAAEAGFKLAELMVKTRRPDRVRAARDLLTEVVATYPNTEWATQATALRTRMEEDAERFTAARRGAPPRGGEPGGGPRGGVRGADVGPPDAPPRATEIELWRLAQIHRDNRRPMQALKALTDLVTLSPQTRFEAWWQLGELYGRPPLNDPQKSRDAYAKVPATSPLYAEAQRRIGAK